MSIKVVKFNVNDQPDFFKELRRRVNTHFKEGNKSKYADTNMKVKSVFMIALYCIPLAYLISGYCNHSLAMYLAWVIMSLGLSGIGLSIMHDANHGAYSKNSKVNSFMSNLLNLIGGYPANWRIQHNVLHHSFTNIHGHDEDIEKRGIVRFSPTQPKKRIYKFQAFYAPFLYGLLTFYWFLGKDFEQLSRYHKMGLLKGQGLTFKKALFEIIFNKVWYTILLLVLPLIMVQLPAWQVITGFLLMHFLSGLILALIFQTAHVINETHFFELDTNGNVENNWAIHQLKTTANYANNCHWFSWLIGGLNYQIEHHLFPNICHTHFKDISKIVKQTTQEYGLPYHEHTSFYSALKSHFMLLNKLGKY